MRKFIVLLQFLAITMANLAVAEPNYYYPSPNKEVLNEIDLSLSLIMDAGGSSPAPWSAYAVRATLRNDGPQTATGVQVSCPKPEGVVYVGGNEYAASQGGFTPYGSNVWTIDELAPGEEVTLVVHYFLVVMEAPVAYAEVRSANESDTDSTPNNGTPPLVNEDDEANTQSTSPNPNECAFIKPAGSYPSGSVNFNTLVEDVHGYAISGTSFLAGSNETRTVTTNIDRNGEWMDITDELSAAPDPPDNIGSVTIHQNNLPNLEVQRILPDGSIAWTRMVSFADEGPLGFASAKGYLTADGILVTGTYVMGPTISFIPFVVQLSLAGEELHRVVNFNLPFNDILTTSTIYKVNSGYVFNAMLGGSELGFLGLSSDANVVWYQRYAQDLPSNTVVDIQVSLDSNYIYVANINNSVSFLEKVDVFTGEEVYFKNLDVGFFDGLGVPAFRSNFDWQRMLLLDDGSVVFGYGINFYPPAVGLGYVFGKLDADGHLLWGNYLEGPRTFKPVSATSDGGYLFVADEAAVNIQNITVMKVTSMGQLSPVCGQEAAIELPCELSYSFAGNSIIVNGAGLNAAHLIIKLFDPNWNTVYACLDTCGMPAVINGLTMSGTYHFSVNTFDPDWIQLCDALVDIPFEHLAGSRVEQRSQDGFVHDFQQDITIYPNPSAGKVTIDVSEFPDDEICIRLTNSLGIPVKNVAMQIIGTQVFQINVNNLSEGIYYVWIERKGMEMLTARKLIVLNGQ